MNQDQMKQEAAMAALGYLPEEGMIGVGTGSTVNFFIEALKSIRNKIEGTVASSKATEDALKKAGIPVYDLNAVGQVAIYVDGADEANDYCYLVKGRGGALTREKIIASVAKKFVCIIDESKKVGVLGGQSPIPVEVIPMARSYVARQIVKLGGNPVYREGFLTDNGNIIIDIHNLDILEPVKMENTLKMLTGAVDNGIFAKRPADILLVSSKSGVATINRTDSVYNNIK